MDFLVLYFENLSTGCLIWELTGIFAVYIAACNCSLFIGRSHSVESVFLQNEEWVWVSSMPVLNLPVWLFFCIVVCHHKVKQHCPSDLVFTESLVLQAEGTPRTDSPNLYPAQKPFPKSPNDWSYKQSRVLPASFIFPGVIAFSTHLGI